MSCDGSEAHGCPEYDCELDFPARDEVLAHLQWDHNRGESKAEEMLDA